jgi:hypothetical protein
MLKHIPRKIKHLKYKKSPSGKFFGAFQVALSNDVVSTVFNAGDVTDQDMQTFNIPDFSLVKRVNGT